MLEKYSTRQLIVSQSPINLLICLLLDNIVFLLLDKMAYYFWLYSAWNMHFSHEMLCQFISNLIVNYIIYLLVIFHAEWEHGEIFYWLFLLVMLQVDFFYQSCIFFFEILSLNYDYTRIRKMIKLDASACLFVLGTYRRLVSNHSGSNKYSNHVQI